MYLCVCICVCTNIHVCVSMYKYPCTQVNIHTTHLTAAAATQKCTHICIHTFTYCSYVHTTHLIAAAVILIKNAEFLE